MHRVQRPLNTPLWSTVAAKEKKQYYMGTVCKVNPQKRQKKQQNKYQKQKEN